MTRLCLLVVLFSSLMSIPVRARCLTDFPEWAPAADAFEWVEHLDYRFSICYDSQRQEDFQYALRWVNHAYNVGATKYGITHPIDRLNRFTVFLYPRPTGGISSGTAKNITSRHVAEIHILSPTLYAEGRSEPLDSFAKVMVHEMMNVLFRDIEPDHFSMPHWILEGLSEYEGWNTTPYNMGRMTGSNHNDLPQRVRRGNIGFGWLATSLSGTTTTFIVSEVYFASAVVMIVLAEQFGEGIHRELFDKPLGEAVVDRGRRKWNIFKEVVFWLERYNARY